jgi:hypothetical protein
VAAATFLTVDLAGCTGSAGRPMFVFFHTAPMVIVVAPDNRYCYNSNGEYDSADCEDVFHVLSPGMLIFQKNRISAFSSTAYLRPMVICNFV